MASKGMEMILKLKGLIDKNLPTEIRKLATETQKLRDRQKELKSSMKLYEEQKKLRKEIDSTVLKYRETRKELKTLEQAKEKNGKLTKEEALKYKVLTDRAKNLEKTLKTQTTSYHKYGMEIKKLKIPFDGLQKEIDETIRKEKELMKEQEKLKAQNTIKNAVGKKGGALKEKVKTGVKYAATAAVATTIGVGVASAKEYLEFDKQMIKVKALTGATAEEYDALKKKAMEVGKTTIFTSEEAAAGMEKFALAGFKPKEIIATIPPIFDLAAASGEDFIMISDMISDHMQSFNLGINDVGHAADILANTMSRSNTNIEMLGEAFKYVSASAHDLHIDLATSSAAIGLMGDQAIKSGQAGTNLRQAFAQLANSDIQAKLKRMGVNVKDNKGEFVGLVDIVRQLDKLTGNMTGIDKLGILKEIFGDRGALAMNKLLTATKKVNGVVYTGADALAQFAKENENATGKAKEMANTILDSASGKWALLESGISDVKLKLGEAIFSSGGTDFILLVTDWLNELSNVLSGNFNNTQANQFWQSFIENGKTALEAIKNIGIVMWNVFKVLNTIGIDNILVFISVFTATSKIIAFGNAVKKVSNTIKTAGGILNALKVSTAALGGPIAAIIAGVVVLGYIIYKNWDKILKFFKKFGLYMLGPIGWIIKLGRVIYENWDKIKAFIGNVLSSIGKTISSIWGSITSWFEELWESIKSLWENIKIAVSNAISTIWENLKSMWNAIVGFFEEYGLYMLGPIGWIIKVGMIIYENWDKIKAFVGEVLTSIGEIISSVWNGIITFISDIVSSISNTLSTLWDTVTTGFTNLLNSFKNIISEIAESIKSFFAKPFEYIDNAISGAKEKAVSFLQDLPLVGGFFKSDTPKTKGINGSHANGLDYVPFDGYIAELHKGERVLTKEENQSGIFTEMRNKLSRNSTGSSNNTNSQNNITAPIEINFGDIIFNGVSEETKNDVLEQFQEKLEELKREIIRIKEAGETNARTSL